MTAAGTHVEVEGAQKLRATLDAASNELGDMHTAQERTGQMVKQRAASNAPKVSGKLAQSVQASVTGLTVLVGSDLVYAGVQEMGWSGHNIKAQPFLRPAAEDTTWLAFYEDDVEKALHKVKGA